MRLDSLSGEFWVLDGHGGDAAAHFGAEALWKEFSGVVVEQQPAARPLMSCCSSPAPPACELPSNEVLVQGFEHVDQRLRAFIEANPERGSGTTVVGAVVVKGKDGTYSLKLANCGDSRCLVVGGPGECEAGAGLVVRRPQLGVTEAPAEDWPLILQSIDHKPDHPTERERIERAGGHVSGDCPPRVDGDLAVSRGLGDFEYKADRGVPASQQKVSCEPDVYEVSGLQAGALCVLACDGLWDVISSDFAAGFVRSRLAQSPDLDLGDLAAEMVRTSLQRGSTDNVTVMLVQLQSGLAWEQGVPDEMMDFHRLHSPQELEEDVRREYLSFLERASFPGEPAECAVCGRWTAGVQQCPCRMAHYCSKGCQQEGWKEHRFECAWTHDNVDAQMPSLVAAAWPAP